jgi:hypothetical protein
MKLLMMMFGGLGMAIIIIIIMKASPWVAPGNNIAQKAQPGFSYRK